jgi:TfoX/Sxy family transcriptional regulator of competence genes
MAYDEGLAHLVREIMAEMEGFDEKKMFGGLCFLLHGNMACGILHNDLIVRVGPDHYEDFLKLPNIRKFDITGRPMKGWIVVSGDGCASEDDIMGWVKKGIDFSLSLPPK